MEDFLGDFTSQLETFQKAFKSKSLSSNHLLWAEAEESRLLETLAQISKQNQSLQSQIDHLLSNSSPKTKPKQSPLKSEMISLSTSISSISSELLHINLELKSKDEMISSLTSKLEILNPPDLGTIGLPSEWKYLEGKQIEYEIISPRFLNDSDDSLKELNEVTVFSPSNKEKRISCKSLDLQRNFGFESEDLRKVYERSKAVEGSLNIWDKEVVVEEYKIGDEEELEEEKVIKNENLIIDYAEEVSEKSKGDAFEIVENYPGWGTEVPEVDLVIEVEQKQSELISNAIIEEKDLLITESTKHNEHNEPLVGETNTVETLLGEEKILEVEASVNKNIHFVEKTESTLISEIIADHPVEETSKASSQNIEEINKNTDSEPIFEEDKKHNNEEFKPKSEQTAEENKKEAYSEPKIKEVKEPEQPPVKKFFTKYQPKVIPKKLQVKKGQIDDFFNELL